jgi:glycosyltransferase involved in cell wall biosynthesis
MKSQALVSVIIPLYNRVALVEQTLQSVIQQTHPHWEAIVVDDGSSDGSYELVKKLAATEQRIKLFQRDRQPKGAPVCRNIGIDKSAGEYLIFLDSDDIMDSSCLKQRIGLFQENKNLDFLVFRTLLFNDDVNDLQIQWNIDTNGDDLLRFFGLDAMWQTTGPIYKKEAILKVGGFKEDLPFWQDFDLHLKCLLAGLTYKKYFNEPPDNYHRRNFKDSISRTIPVVADPAILQKRIDYYLYLIAFIKQKEIAITQKQKYALWSVLFYFTSSYFRKHNNLQKFIKEWNRVREALDINWLSHQLNLLYGILKGLSDHNIAFRKLNSLYARVFKRKLANYYILSQSKLGKIGIKSE